MAWHGSPQMDKEDLQRLGRLAVGERRSHAPKDTRPASAEGSGAASGGDLLGRLRDLQRQVAELAGEIAPHDGVVPGAGTRIVIVPSTPQRPELPPHRPAPARDHAPERHRRSSGERRAGPRERRARRDRRRHRRDPRPVAQRVERRVATEDRRSGRGDRRLGHDRRAAGPPRPRRERRRMTLVLAAGLEVLVLAAGVLALVQ
jgi:hypothetical protein